ncbi:MAG: MFS transporter [Hyphomicrobiales bacterium]|nr:MFS transporter [Hyphomicrobiales bacterium]MDE2115547.1 MFS transporter [Hyphomicrobiales bacterium]
MDSIEQRTISKVTWRLVPFLMFCYFIAFLDRVNNGFAGGPMSKDLGLSASQFGFAAGIFFIAYFFFEVPSNLALDKFGARRWIARIMFTWGLVSVAQGFVTGIGSFTAVRLLLGVAEAGFFPGIIFFLTLWFPSVYRARIVGLFMFAIPISTVIGSPISGIILDHLNGVMGLHGWQWMFIVEAIPALIMAFVVWFYLTDRPSDANWLADDEKKWLQGRLDSERALRESKVKLRWTQVLANPRVWALGIVYYGITGPQYGLSFFLPQIIKGFGGLSNTQVGLINAFPFAVGAVTMILWSRMSDAAHERKIHFIIPALAITVGLVGAALFSSPTLQILSIAVASFGFFASLPVFWTLPTAYLSGTAAAAGIAAVNSIGNLGGYIGPQVFGLLKDYTGSAFAGYMFLASLGLLAAVIVLIIGHDPAMEKAGAAPAE